MGFLSNNFPTIARIFGGGNKSGSKARPSPERGRRRARATETRQPEIEVSAPGDSAPQIESGSPVGVAEAREHSPVVPSEATSNEAAAGESPVSALLGLEDP